MKNLMTAMSLMLLTIAMVTPAEANWFSSRGHSTMFNIGSVRNPTPQELRFYYAKAEADRQAKAAHKN